MREPELYREMLESILTHTDGKRILTNSEVARLMGKTRPWCKERLGVGKHGITAEALAYKLATEFV